MKAKWIRLTATTFILSVVALSINASSLEAAESDVVVVTARGYIAELPQGFTATYIDIGQVDLAWTKGGDAVNTLVRAAYNRLPSDVTDGYEVYFGDAESFTDTAMDFDEYLGKIYYAAWSENGAGAYTAFAASAEVEGVPMTLFALVFIALGLTIAMFATRNSMLGFPAALFWAILGGYAYTESTIPWGDWQFYLAFASLLGMVTFTVLAAYGLREKRDTIAETEMDEESREKDGLFDEEPEPDLSGDVGKSGPSRREALHSRADARRARGKGRRDDKNFGAFS